MRKNEAVLGGALGRVGHNKRYIFWFYVLNVALAWLGAGAFQAEAHEILDHSLIAGRLVRGFDLGVLIEMFFRPEFGSLLASAAPAMHFAVLYFLLTALFMPGVLQGYAATYRLPRDEFFHACGRSLWRFVRLMIVAFIVVGILSAALFGLRDVLMDKALESTNELLRFEVSVSGLCVIFLVMTAVRVWFDLAETDVVLSDQRAVGKSLGAGFRHAWKSLGRLLGTYVLIAVIGIGVLVGGIFCWIKFVPASSIFGAAVVSQFTLILLLIARFWQRGVAVTYYLRDMVEPVAEKHFMPEPSAAPVAGALSSPPEPAGS
jgi:hypothetical protein